MENPCKIMFFGDSIIKGCTPVFEKQFLAEYPEIELSIINAGAVGETTRDGLIRLQQLVDQKPTVAVIGFGMNDWRKGVSRKEYKRNLIQMLEAFEAVGTRVIMNTVSPSYNFSEHKYNCEVDEYSDDVREIAYEKRIKVADINALWKRELKNIRKGLKDDLHPNHVGYALMCKSLMWVIPRRNTTVLWQYNGHEAQCNYRCPYCYYLGLHSPVDRSFGAIEEWHHSLKASFGNQHLVFYLGFGEPTLGSRFPEIVEMVHAEKNWELRVISNLDTEEIRKTAKHPLAEEGRFHVVGSFHPSMTTREKYLEKLEYFRACGMETPSVYVAYPPYFPHFLDDIEFFRKHAFLMHVRRFYGQYKGKGYPISYTEEERMITSKYQDDGMLKYMQSDVCSHRELTYSGLHFFVMDNVGNMGYDIDCFKPYTKWRCIFGNIHQRNFRPLLLPSPYPGYREGTDDGTANIIKRGYKELEGNHVMSFARQGGVYRDEDGKIVYGNEHKDFTDSKIRAQYWFPPRNIKDFMAYNREMKVLYMQKYALKLVRQGFGAIARPAYHKLRGLR